MKMSPAAIEALVKTFEGCKLKAYLCPAGILTIGYGHTSAAGAPDVKAGMEITLAQADEILRADLAKFERGVDRLVTTPIGAHQFDVLVGFAYNVGLGALEKSSLLRAVNARDFDRVPDELMKWTRAGGKVLPGLVRRRQAEVAWWLSMNAAVPARETPDPVPVKTITTSKQANSAAAIGALGSVGAAKEIVSQIQEANETFDMITGLLTNDRFLIMLAIVGLGAAIWYWRKRHLEEKGV